MKKKKKQASKLEKDRERTLGLPVTSPAQPRSERGGDMGCCEVCVSLRSVDKPTRCCSTVSSSKRAA